MVFYITNLLSCLFFIFRVSHSQRFDPSYYKDVLDSHLPLEEIQANNPVWSYQPSNYDLFDSKNAYWRHQHADHIPPEQDSLDSEFGVIPVEMMENEPDSTMSDMSENVAEVFAHQAPTFVEPEAVTEAKILSPDFQINIDPRGVGRPEQAILVSDDADNFFKRLGRKITTMIL